MTAMNMQEVRQMHVQAGAYLCSISAVQQHAVRNACPGVFALECVGSQVPWHGRCRYEPMCQFSAWTYLT